MPSINVLYWNVQNFGNTPQYKPNCLPLCSFIANIAAIYNADILFIQELKQPAVANNILQILQQQLCLLPAPSNNWYYDWIPGAIDYNAVAPFATHNDTMWDGAHYEGYAMFWNQNIAKFILQPAPPLAGPTVNSQSGGCTALLKNNMGAIQLDQAVPNNIGIPNNNPGYIIPTGTTLPGQAASIAPQNVNAGTVIPAGTLIGAHGVQAIINAGPWFPVVVPGGYTLTDPLTLPDNTAVLIPQHPLSLVLEGLNPNPLATFAPAGPNVWVDLPFTRGAGFPAAFTGCRRPALATLDVNRNPAPANRADRLVPLMVYHAPSANWAATRGMAYASRGRPLYQVYDAMANNWINSTFAVLGGDMNVHLDDGVYGWFFDPFANQGADCQPRVAAPIPMGGNTRADNVLNKSTVQVDDLLTHQPVFSAATDDYRRLAIDNIFYRGFTAATAPAPVPAPVFDSLLASTNNYANLIAQPTIRSFLQLPIFQQSYNAHFHGVGVAPATPGINSIGGILTGLTAGHFSWPVAVGNNTPARRAAEFTNYCVSDHLPTLFSMQL